MTIEELECAVATSPETHKFESHRLVPGAIFISLCRGLITVEEESSLVRLVRKLQIKSLQTDTNPFASLGRLYGKRHFERTAP